MFFFFFVFFIWKLNKIVQESNEFVYFERKSYRVVLALIENPIEILDTVVKMCN